MGKKKSRTRESSGLSAMGSIINLHGGPEGFLTRCVKRFSSGGRGRNHDVPRLVTGGRVS